VGTRIRYEHPSLSELAEDLITLGACCWCGEEVSKPYTTIATVHLGSQYESHRPARLPSVEAGLICRGCWELVGATRGAR